MRIIIVFLLLITSCSPLKKFEGTATKWEKDITKLENLDKSKNQNKDAILFIGSSSIRLWRSIKKDLAPYEPIKRAYGGARYTDLIHFTERLVSPHDVKAVGIFVANDITGGKNDLKPREVLALSKLVVKQIQKSHKNSPIFFIETTPTPKRWTAWDKISNANDLIKKYCESKTNLFYISTRNHFISENKLPIEDYFIRDKLHLNSKGYLIWGDIIKDNLKNIVGSN
tara:strand:+ start:113 stop:793 length:681 start_codon:yes stop_codon:yes gene_type:complete